MFETQDMLEVLEQTHVPGDFLLTTFVSPEPEEHLTDKIEIDIERNGKKMAPFVSPIKEGKVLRKEGYENRIHQIPYVKIKRPFTAQQILNRQPGSTIYGNRKTPAQFIAEQMGKTVAEIDVMILRREEKMAAEAIQTGKIVVQGEGLSYEIDFGMKETHRPGLIGSTERWNETTADIQKNFRDWARLVKRDSGMNATDAILGSDASVAAFANSKFMDSLDRRLVDRGEIVVEKLPKFVTYFGRDRESGLNLWGYDEQYFDDDSGTMKELIGTKNVVVGSRASRFIRHYGAIQNVESTFVGKVWPSSWTTKDPSATWIMLESAPLVALHQPDAFFCAQVLA